MQTPLRTAAQLFMLITSDPPVLAQVLQGQTLKEVAAFLGVARPTVKTHLDSIYAKSRTRRQSDLVKTVVGLVTAVR